MVESLRHNDFLWFQRVHNGHYVNLRSAAAGRHRDSAPLSPRSRGAAARAPAQAV